MTDAELTEIAERCGWATRTIAREAGLPYGGALRERVRRLREAAASGPPSLTVTPLPSPDIPIDELVTARIRAFERKRAHEDSRKLIPIPVSSSLPIGILHFGDPHIDDDGTDLGMLQRHARLVRETPGLYGANVGDTTNNWTGRLARLYAQQGTSACDAWRLGEWFIREVRDWLYVVGGNHDLWSGAGDPLNWICAGAGAMYAPSEVRVALRFPNEREVRVNCRHDFAGHSQYNPAHGVTKAIIFGVRDHIVICGHKHVSGYNISRDPESGIACHGIQVASYKLYDRYAREHGFRDQTLSPCVVTVIDPSLPPAHPGLVKVFWDAEEGADYLTYLRKRQAA